MSLARLSIVIPTYCRQDYILRQMQYWYCYDLRLIILDASPSAIDLPNEFEGCEKILYLHMPAPIEERMAKSVALVDTEFTALLSDDEFLLPSALKSCIDFLDQNPSYSACKGRAVGFGWGRGYVEGKPVYPELAGYHIDRDTGEARMYQHMSPYAMASLWSVQRRGVFKECMKAVSIGPPFSSAAAAELQISLITAYLGKVKVLDQLLWLRSYENKNIWWKNGDLSILKWWRDSNMVDEHKRFLESIVSVKSRDNNQERHPDEASVADAIEIYAKRCEKKRSIPSARRIMGRIMPAKIKDRMKNISRHLGRTVGENHLSLIAAAEKLEVLGVQVDYEELNDVGGIIRSFHQNRAKYESVEDK